MLPKAKVVPCAYSQQVFETLARGKVQAAVVPIENSLAGPVTEHYDLLLEHRCYIERELQMRIVHNMIAAPGVKLAQLRRVLSHPVALAQCRKLFQNYPKLTAEPFYDTAGAVKHILSEGSCEAAGIASTLAAKEYGGHILKAGIEDNKANFTRFILVRKLRGKKLPVARGASKASLAFFLKNETGTLFRALQAFAQAGISLSKIESRPLSGKPWEYVFYVDVLSGDSAAFRRALANLQKAGAKARVLGVYSTR